MHNEETFQRLYESPPILIIRAHQKEHRARNYKLADRTTGTSFLINLKSPCGPNSNPRRPQIDVRTRKFTLITVRAFLKKSARGGQPS